jgi:hypothetical protein
VYDQTESAGNGNPLHVREAVGVEEEADNNSKIDQMPVISSFCAHLHPVEINPHIVVA